MTRLDTPSERLIGMRLRQRRKQQKLSLDKLAELTNITSQQIQKYEIGINRVSASRLADFARLLDVPVGYFYQDLEDKNSIVSLAEDLEAYQSLEDQIDNKEKHRLLSAYAKIKNNKTRKLILGMAEKLAQEAQSEE